MGGSGLADERRDEVDLAVAGLIGPWGEGGTRSGSGAGCCDRGVEDGTESWDTAGAARVPGGLGSG